MSGDDLEEVLYWLGREITEARRAMWDGKSGKAFASLEAAEEEFEKLEEMIDTAENDTEPADSVEDN